MVGGGRYAPRPSPGARSRVIRAPPSSGLAIVSWAPSTCAWPRAMVSPNPCPPESSGPLRNRPGPSRYVGAIRRGTSDSECAEGHLGQVGTFGGWIQSHRFQHILDECAKCVDSDTDQLGRTTGASSSAAVVRPVSGVRSSWAMSAATLRSASSMPCSASAIASTACAS